MITELQLKLYNFIKDYFNLHGFCPTFTEMKKYMGSSSNQTIKDKLNALEQKGYIKQEHKARAIVLLKDTEDKWFEGEYSNCKWRTTDIELAKRLGQLGTFYEVRNMSRA